MLLIAGCSSSSNNSWAYSFVQWEGKTYIVTDNKVEKNKIGKEIGKVTTYSDREGTYFGNFSNTYKAGTKYYEIIGIDRNQAIAVEKEEGLFIQAESNGIKNK